MRPIGFALGALTGIALTGTFVILSGLRRETNDAGGESDAEAAGPDMAAIDARLTYLDGRVSELIEISNTIRAASSRQGVAASSADGSPDPQVLHSSFGECKVALEQHTASTRVIAERIDQLERVFVSAGVLAPPSNSLELLSAKSTQWSALLGLIDSAKLDSEATLNGLVGLAYRDVLGTFGRPTAVIGRDWFYERRASGASPALSVKFSFAGDFVGHATVR